MKVDMGRLDEKNATTWKVGHNIKLIMIVCVSQSKSAVT